MSNVGELVQAVRGSGLPTSGGSDRSSSAISFGARQAIIVRNNDSRKALPMPEFKNATILTVAECKGATPLLLIVCFHTLLMCLPHLPTSSSHFSSLSPMTSGLEFDDVLLFNFFHDSLAKSDWRLFLNYLFSVLLPLQANREPGDDTILPTNGPIFGSEGHPLEPSQLQGGMDQFKLFESELKQLYVAVTRPRVRLWIFDQGDDNERTKGYWKRTPFFEFLERTMLCETWSSEVFARSSTPAEHVQAAKMLHKRAEEEQSMELYKTAAARWSEGGRPAEKSLCQVPSITYLLCHHIRGVI